ncbi:MAG: hypothetical protein DRI32_05950 [Chloroflexi bacterium]|nr:MAG: hypothetical protein DRI32_05950 [Chloroflexota bacterium]
MVMPISLPIELTSQDWKRILVLGSQQRSNELKAEVAKTEKIIAGFKVRFGMSLSHLEEVGLSADADFETHEAYIEWHSWENRLKDLQHRLETLQNLEPDYVG